MRRLPASLLVLGVASLAPPATASANPATPRAKIQRYRVQTPDSSIQAGAARTTVRAPLEVVRRVVTDYNRYGQYIDKFEKARIVGKSPGRTDVYLQVPILRGLAHVWAVVRFGPVEIREDGTARIVGHMVKGNLKRLDAEWRLKKKGEGTTELDLQLLVIPDLPAPGSVITGEVAYAASKAVQGLRNQSERAQGSPRPR